MTISFEGIEYLKKFTDEINRNILEILYENRFNKTLTVTTIKKGTFIRLKNKEVEAYLKLLKDRGYVKVEKERIPAIKNGNKTISQHLRKKEIELQIKVLSS